MRTKIFIIAIATVALCGAEQIRGGGVGKKSRGASTNMTVAGGSMGVMPYGGSGTTLPFGGSSGKRVESGGSTNGRA